MYIPLVATVGGTDRPPYLKPPLWFSMVGDSLLSKVLFKFLEAYSADMFKAWAPTPLYYPRLGSLWEAWLCIDLILNNNKLKSKSVLLVFSLGRLHKRAICFLHLWILHHLLLLRLCVWEISLRVLIDHLLLLLFHIDISRYHFMNVHHTTRGMGVNPKLVPG
jgi:hypothetical protein